MIRSTQLDDERFLNAIDGLTRRISKAQTEISSGKRIHSLADEPDRIAPLLGLRSNISRVEQVQKNLGHFRTEVDAAEKVISQAVRLVERARVLGAQGVSGIQTAASRAGIAVEVQNLAQQIAGIANTAVAGRYIFSGDSDNTIPFTFSAGPPPAISAYAGSSPTRQALGPTGQAFPTAHSGDQIFSNANPTRDVFGAVLALHSALIADDQAAIGNALALVSTAGEHINEQLAFYGAVQNNLSDADKISGDLLIRFRNELSAAEDADLVEAISEINRLQLARDAALSAQAKFPKRSLFDYI